MTIDDDGHGELYKYPEFHGVWGIEIDEELQEVEAIMKNGHLVVHASELEDIGLVTDNLEEYEEDSQYILADSLGQDDGAEVWQLID